MSTPNNPRRTLTSLPRRTDPNPAVSRLMRSNREAAPAPTSPAPLNIPPTAAASPPDPVGVPTPGPDLEQTSPNNDRPTEDSGSNRVTDSGVDTTPKYLRLTRREARVHSHQVDSLGRLTRRLNNARRRPGGKPAGERLTDNTLLRVAIDLLLQQQDQLTGTTEDELRTSLGLNPNQDEN